MGVAILVIAACITGSILLHLYVLRLLWAWARRRLDRLNGIRLAALVVGCVIGHVLEIAIFTAGIATVALSEDNTHLAFEGLDRGKLDLWYYSAAFFTSLGEKRPPSGELRVFAACETLTGLLLITWTASFLFLLMQRSWSADAMPPRGAEPPP
jgi:hypothetical protein